ncbi:MAG: UDP-N-acetylmuramoyl-L-alanine--D-glutamate ligase [Demequinaceae bacterium]|nr:UDP-N-acetylmuramoyl-L-alanine--D-glutamate ligase [Demequinaceae bacterium]
MGRDPVSIAGARVLVLGMGVTGRAVVEALRGASASTVTVDGREPADHRDLSGVDLTRIDFAIASPGWPPSGESLRAVEAAGIEVWSEVELAWRLRESSTPWVVVTGTNGKTTTVRMVGAMAEAAGLQYAVVGNVGDAVVTKSSEALDVLVVEISSFQLHYTSSVEPHASVCLNVDDDHLDWHGGADGYRSAKAKVYEGTREACLFPTGCPEIEEMVRDAEVAEGCRAIGLSLDAPAVSQIGVVEGILLDRAFLVGRQTEALELAKVSDLAHLVAGTVPSYLVANALAAAGLARSIGIEPGRVAEGLRGFRLDAHRTAHVATIADVVYVDDSKATNLHAARAALGGFPAGTIVWILGGLAKGADLAPLIREAAPRLRAAIVIGLEQEAIIEAFGRHAPAIPLGVIAPGDTVMERAVRAAREHAHAGDTVLLSPACASMDQFRDYADRGEAFSAAVRALEG